MPFKSEAHERGHHARRARLREMSERAKQERWMRCVDCGLQYPAYVLDWDHRPGEEKVASVAYLARRSIALFEAEIAKCDLVCANCHRIRTHERGYENESKGVQRADRNPRTGRKPPRIAG